MTTASPGEQGSELPTPVSCVTGSSEVSQHVAVLLQRGDDHHDALSKTTSSLGLDILAYFC
jgi:hypothetical protein